MVAWMDSRVCCVTLYEVTGNISSWETSDYTKLTQGDAKQTSEPQHDYKEAQNIHKEMQNDCKPLL